jgi:thymidine kinase
MKVIARPMGTGKTEELLRLAAEDKALVLTDNKSDLQTKANNYGIAV